MSDARQPVAPKRGVYDVDLAIYITQKCKWVTIVTYQTNNIQPVNPTHVESLVQLLKVS